LALTEPSGGELIGRSSQGDAPRKQCRATLGDTYFHTHFQVDAQGGVRLARGLTFVMCGLNLNNEVFGFYEGSPQYMIQREYDQPTIAAGFRWSPSREK